MGLLLRKVRRGDLYYHHIINIIIITIIRHIIIMIIILMKRRKECLARARCRPIGRQMPFWHVLAGC